jgi:hypothetical protein
VQLADIYQGFVDSFVIQPPTYCNFVSQYFVIWYGFLNLFFKKPSIVNQTYNNEKNVSSSGSFNEPICLCTK